uniref:Uncharacterized protein n=1 Tax=Tupiella akineta TaxID=160070 RepID=Q3ZJ91_TUPAK|nr:hypothetical protein PsakCp003 [Tupiella akineta]AAV80601.1 hypothetical protein [Tupiella akineta]
MPSGLLPEVCEFTNKLLLLKARGRRKRTKGLPKACRRGADFAAGFYLASFEILQGLLLASLLLKDSFARGKRGKICSFHSQTAEAKLRKKPSHSEDFREQPCGKIKGSVKGQKTCL